MQEGKPKLQKAVESNISLMQVHILLVLIMETLIGEILQGHLSLKVFLLSHFFKNKRRNKHGHKDSTSMFIHTFVIISMTLHQ